ncbi:hypothetical protein [Erythrobacter sp. MTPC3]|uniref:hypothetical protein n=1 Tax=Erythrobacter sp. MTPC3 TaxID=3056564 RepID=UPI0036F398C8
MRTIYLLSSISIGLLAASPAQACLPIPQSRVEATADVVVVGRYIRRGEDLSRGRIAVFQVERGDATKMIDVVWSLSILDDPSTADCAVQIPSDGGYEKFWLIRQENSSFVVIGRGWIEDPLERAKEAAER